MVRTFLVHEQNLLRATLRNIMSEHLQLQVVGEADTAAVALENIVFLEPDLVLTGLSFSDFDGIELTRRTVAALPETKILAVTAHPERTHLLRFLSAGGLGYLNRLATDSDLLEAIDQVLRGEVFLSPEGVQLVASQYRQRTRASDEPCTPQARPDGPSHDPPPSVLSTRERQVLHFMAHGYSSAEIGTMLFLSGKTIDTYKRRIRNKLCLERKADLLAYALRSRVFDDWE